MNYLDLFSGIGGFALGAYWAGMRFDNHYFSEVEKFPVELYQKRFPDAIPLGDITKIDCSKLPQGDWIITGGFPCQDISCAGKGKGLIDESTGEKTRSGLWFTYADIISKLRPRFAIMENVGALTIRGLDAVLGSLAEIGYDAEWQDIRAEDMGAPHRRERIWIVAYPRCELRNEGNTTGMEKDKAKRSACELHNKPSGEGQAEMADTVRKGLERQYEQKESSGAISEKGKPFCRINSPIQNGNNWAVEPGVGRLANGVPNRVDRLKGLGNAIVPQIAELLFRQIKPYV